MIVLAALLAASRLIVFQQPGSLTSRDFEEKTLPRLAAIAAQRGIVVDVRDATKGAPSDVHLTPLIVYQDEKGRSIFRGRYADVDRIAQFLRTAAAAPLAGAPIPYENAAVWHRERLAVVAPIKITGLTGVRPPQFEPAVFAARARRSVLAGLTRFHLERRVALEPADRAFYMDFHPYRDASGRLFVSTAIYSGFDCVTPIYSGFDEPVSGSFTQLDEVFARAAKRLEDTVARLSASSPVGDAFEPVSTLLPRPTWEALGLTLPAVTAESPGRVPPPAAPKLPDRWVVDPELSKDPPPLQFRFAPPLDSYSGEVGTISGRIVLGKAARLRGATGTLDAQTGTVTMGDKTLDAELKSTILKVARHPTARFVLDPVDVAAAALSPGVPAPFTATGRFSLLGATAPLTVKAQAEPVLAEDGTWRLDVRAAFRVRLLEPFGLHGPDGPAPANDTILFDARFVLKPEAAGAGVSPSASR